jgi:hypothetical protein
MEMEIDAVKRAAEMLRKGGRQSTEATTLLEASERLVVAAEAHLKEEAEFFSGDAFNRGCD